MKKSALIFTTTYLLLSLCLYLVLRFADYESIHTELFKAFELNKEHYTISKPKVKINRFLMPYIYIAKLENEGIVEVYDAEITFSILSLLQLEPSIASINIAQLNISDLTESLGIMNHDQWVALMITKKIIKSKMHIDNIFITQKNELLFTINDVKYNDNNLSANMNGANIALLLNQTQDEQVLNLLLKITHDHYNIQIEESYHNAQLLHGDVQITIVDLKQFVTNHFPKLNNLLVNNDVQQSLQVAFDIDNMQDTLNINNLNIVSDVIFGQGTMQLSKIDEIISSASLNFNEINLDLLFDVTKYANQNHPNTKHVPSVHARSFVYDIFPSDITMNIDTNIDYININDELKLNNAKISSKLIDGQFYINDCFSQIGQEGKLQISGVINNNSIRHMFQGNLNLEYQDLNQILKLIGYQDVTVNTVTPFALSSEIIITPIDAYLINAVLNTDYFNITGNIASKTINDTDRVNFLLNISSIDLNKTDYPILSPIVQFLYNLSQGMHEDNYLDKLNPVKDLSHVNNFDITFNDLLISDQYIGNVNIVGKTSPTAINIDNIYINNDKDYLSSSIKLLFNGFRPELYVKINDGQWQSDVLHPKSLLIFKQLLVDHIDFSKVLIHLDCQLSKLYQNDLILENIKFFANYSDNTLNISDIAMNVFGGDLNADVKFLLNPYSINTNYKLNEAHLKDILLLLPFSSISNNNELISLNGQFSTKGSTLAQLLYNLYFKSSVTIQDMLMNNFSIDQFIEKVNINNYQSSEIHTLSDEAMTKGTTLVKNVKGNIEVDNGVISVDDIEFETLYSVGTANATINIYNNFDLQLFSKFNFYIIPPRYRGLNYSEDLIDVEITATGNFFDPHKIINHSKLLRIFEMQTLRNMNY